jgi:hypothetical protein
LWTRDEYDRMIEAGILHPESRLELIEGEILHKGASHAEQQTVSPGNRIAPLACPDSPIAVDDLLP